MIVAGVTSNTERVLIGDVLIAEWHAGGLLYPSVVTGILRTIKQSTMVRKLGTLTSRDMDDVATELRLSLGMVD